MKGLLTATLLAAATAFAAVAATPGAARAQSLAPEWVAPSPERRVVVLRPRSYADPTLPVRDTGLGAISLPAIRDAMVRYLDEQPSFVAAPLDPDGQLVRLGHSATQSDLVALARQATRLGIGHYDLYDLSSAIDELDAATQTWQRTAAVYTDAESVAEAYLYLALALLERREVDPEQIDADEARARAAFRAMIRLDPGRMVTPDSYPPSVVDVYRAAYLDHLMDGGRTLGLSLDEGRRLTDQLDTDAVVVVTAMTGADGTMWAVQLYDADTDTLALDDRMRASDSTDSVVDALTFALSDAVACLDPLDAIEPPPLTDRGHGYAAAGAAIGTFVRDPVDGALIHAGPTLAFEWAPHEAVAVQISSQILFSGRDSDGDLLATIDTWRVGASPVIYGRWERFRLGLGAGIEVARSTDVLATESFWCRVSGGDVVEFGEGRSCAAEDVTRQDATLYVGGTTHVEAGVALRDPLWLQFEAGASFFVIPSRERALDLPLTLAIRGAYRF